MLASNIAGPIVINTCSMTYCNLYINDQIYRCRSDACAFIKAISHDAIISECVEPAMQSELTYIFIILGLIIFCIIISCLRK